ncbi:winged helix-turn-helix domain-containing protein [Mucilaginibacter lutimaris]|uniref:Winged helix-turn-helix domain-containing protein n=1 Tax=Mucilaginibacter lutimaris TaxID=931629 RepID=A0ABW2ZHF0_9SPHI
MPNKRNLLSGKNKYFFGSILLLLIAGVSAAFGLTNNNDFDIARREVLLRKLGHELLLQSGDSTSRVLPVTKITDNEYQISFENKLTFQPDSLVDITRRLLFKNPLASDFVVNVLKDGNAGIAYGYAISQNRKDDIVACTGRKQPRANYIIDVKFKPSRLNTAKSKYLLGSLPLLSLIGFIFWRSGRPRASSPNVRDSGMVILGSMLFDAKNRKLVINGNTIELTGTETRVLHIFATSPNQTIERSRLQKEIWEDEGVIVGRSLDMFISKLRKKLESEPNVKIVVIRGKGYKLEIAIL